MEAVAEIWHQENDDDFSADYTLQFIAGGRLYRGNLRNFGDWYDGERTTEMVNRALSDLGRKERFILLAGRDQFAEFVFADPDLFKPLAKKFNILCESDSATEDWLQILLDSSHSKPV